MYNVIIILARFRDMTVCEYLLRTAHLIYIHVLKLDFASFTVKSIYILVKDLYNNKTLFIIYS